MANQGGVMLLPNHPAVQPQHIAPAVARDRLHLLDAARALMLFGAAATMWTVGNPDAEQVLLGLVTWLLGVCLLSFVPVAGRFPQAAALAGAAIASANAIFRHIMFTPWN
ncbi:unnamed protein product [Urochloa decumbens]|uniref:Uncharacterized protein n=1 Tax=Urochloa decumbens TaxID=240449 RepID=A0ABC9E2F2_9POAL